MATYRIVLADDHILLREGLKKILEGADDVEVVGEAGDGLELLTLLNQVLPDMVILDITMPKLRGIEAVHEIRATHPGVGVLILTMHKDKEYLSLALSAGAKGYLLKEDAPKELFTAIDRIRQGKTYLSPYFAEQLIDQWTQTGKEDMNPITEADPLTVREREVLKLIAEGKSGKEIADLLFISVRTVDHHRASIMEKLKLKNAAELVKYAIQKGYI